MDLVWLKDYRIIDNRTLLHIACIGRVEVGLAVWDPVLKEFRDLGDEGDSLYAFYLCAMGHQLEHHGDG